MHFPSFSFGLASTHKSSHMQEEEIVEFDKEVRERERERERESLCSPTLSSTQLVLILSALPA